MKFLNKWITIIILMTGFGSLLAQEQEVIIYPDKDALIMDLEIKGVNFLNKNFGDTTSFQAGRWTYNGNWFNIASLIAFNIDQIPQNACISEAYVVFTGKKHYPYSIKNEAHLVRIENSWDENTVTWNTKPKTSPDEYKVIISPEYTDQTYNIDIKSIVQSWVDGTSNNHGLMLKFKDEEVNDYALLDFYSSEIKNGEAAPKVVIKYIIPEKITIYPNKDSFIKFLYGKVIDDYSNSNYGNNISIESSQWTELGNWYNTRGLIEFDLSTLPKELNITNASLTLSGVEHSNLGRINESFLYRNSEEWSENEVNWNNQPNHIDDSLKVYLKSSSLSNEIYKINVTDLVNGWYEGSFQNYGLKMMLVSETPKAANYTRLSFASKENTKIELKPKLEIFFLPKKIDFQYTVTLNNDNKEKKVEITPTGGVPPYLYIWDDATFLTLSDIQSKFDSLPELASQTTPEQYYNTNILSLYVRNYNYLKQGIHKCLIVDSKGNKISKDIIVGQEIVAGAKMNCNISNTGKVESIDVNKDFRFSTFNEISSKTNTYFSIKPTGDNFETFGLRASKSQIQDDVEHLFIGVKFSSNNLFDIYKDGVIVSSKNTFDENSVFLFYTDSVTDSLFLMHNSKLLYKGKTEKSDSYGIDYFHLSNQNSNNSILQMEVAHTITDALRDPWIENPTLLAPEILYNKQNPNNCETGDNGTVSFSGEVNSTLYTHGDILSFKVFKKNNLDWVEISNTNTTLNNLGYGFYKYEVEYKVYYSYGGETLSDNFTLVNYFEMLENISWENIIGMDEELPDGSHIRYQRYNDANVSDLFHDPLTNTPSIENVIENNELAGMFSNKILGSGSSGWIEFKISIRNEPYSSNLSYFGFTDVGNVGSEFLKYGYIISATSLYWSTCNMCPAPSFVNNLNAHIYKITEGSVEQVTFGNSPWGDGIVDQIVINTPRIERDANGNILLYNNGTLIPEATIYNTDINDKLYFQIGTYNRAIISPGLSTFPCQSEQMEVSCELLLDQTKNYILTSSPNQSIKSISSSNLYNNKVNQNIVYFDGLGKQIQSININSSPLERDIIQPIYYDENGFQSRIYLPFVSNTCNQGQFVQDAYTHQNTFYQNPPNSIAESEFPFYDIIYENSPLNRVIETGAPGEDWQIGLNHTQVVEYGLNQVTIPLLKFNYTSNKAEFLRNYSINELFVIKNTMDNLQSFEFKNSFEQIVVSASKGTTETLWTLYVYDDFGNLRVVIPPRAYELIKSENYNWSKLSDNDFISKWLFVYNFDSRNRLIEKKIPGKGQESFEYDNLDRMVYRQDGNMKAIHPNYKEYYIYDFLNRKITEGIHDINIDKPLHRIYYDSYTNVSVTNGFSQPYYQFINEAGFEENSHLEKCKNYIVGEQKYIQNSNIWLNTVYYYDKKGRMIQTISDNLVGGYDIVSFLYNFNGEIILEKQTHKEKITGNIYNETLILKRYKYDFSGRLEQTYYKLNEQPEILLSEFEYNELGQQITKKLHKTIEHGFLQEINTNYNIRGWLTQINNPEDLGEDLFGMSIDYNEPTVFNNSNPQYNGNISAIEWATPANSTLGKDASPQAYAFNYDDFNRLTNAQYANLQLGTASNYNLEIPMYDSNGNIKMLRRNGLINGSTFGQIDDLNYYYNGNQLFCVNDNIADGINRGDFSDFGTTGVSIADNFSTHEYIYDANGNLTEDKQKNYTIAFDDWNMPKEINFPSGTKIKFHYDMLGQLYQKVVENNGSINHNQIYNGSIIYENNEINYIFTDEGRAIKTNTSNFQFEYFIKDYLGHTRISFTDNNQDGIAELIQENHYDPFGLTLGGLNFVSGSNSNMNKFLFGGKELFDEEGLLLYNFGVRFYDAQLGRWNSVDPMAHMRTEWSPYNAFRDNPILNIDPNGALDSPVYDTEGSFLGTDDQGLQGLGIVMKKEDFKQGMKHKDALKKNLGAKGLKTDQAKKNFSQSYRSLPSRPDYDGKITIDEADKWYRDGNNTPLYADLSQIDLKFITTSVFNNRVGASKYIQTFYDSEDGGVYGHLTLTYQGNNSVSCVSDNYGFEMHYAPSNKSNVGDRMSENAKRMVRNMATFGGRIRANRSLLDNGKAFDIMFYNQGTISN